MNNQTTRTLVPRYKFVTRPPVCFGRFSEMNKKKQKITIQSKNNDHSKKRKRKNKEKNHTTIQQPTKIMTTPKNDNLWIMEGLLNWGKTECFGSLVLHSLLITEGNFPE